MPVLVVNGKPREFDAAAFPESLLALVKLLSLSPEALVAEVDGQIVARELFADQPLLPGANVELVQLVGGG